MLCSRQGPCCRRITEPAEMMKRHYVKQGCVRAYELLMSDLLPINKAFETHILHLNKLQIWCLMYRKWKQELLVKLQFHPGPTLHLSPGRGFVLKKIQTSRLKCLCGLGISMQHITGLFGALWCLQCPRPQLTYRRNQWHLTALLYKMNIIHQRGFASAEQCLSFYCDISASPPQKKLSGPWPSYLEYEH